MSEKTAQLNALGKVLTQTGTDAAKTVTNPVQNNEGSLEMQVNTTDVPMEQQINKQRFYNFLAGAGINKQTADELYNSLIKAGVPAPTIQNFASQMLSGSTGIVAPRDYLSIAFAALIARKAALRSTSLQDVANIMQDLTRIHSQMPGLNIVGKVASRIRGDVSDTSAQAQQWFDSLVMSASGRGNALTIASQIEQIVASILNPATAGLQIANQVADARALAANAKQNKQELLMQMAANTNINISHSVARINQQLAHFFGTNKLESLPGYEELMKVVHLVVIAGTVIDTALVGIGVRKAEGLSTQRLAQVQPGIAKPVEQTEQGATAAGHGQTNLDISALAKKYNNFADMIRIDNFLGLGIVDPAYVETGVFRQTTKNFMNSITNMLSGHDTLIGSSATGKLPKLPQVDVISPTEVQGAARKMLDMIAQARVLSGELYQHVQGLIQQLDPVDKANALLVRVMSLELIESKLKSFSSELDALQFQASQILLVTPILVKLNRLENYINLTQAQIRQRNSLYGNEFVGQWGYEQTAEGTTQAQPSRVMFNLYAKGMELFMQVKQALQKFLQARGSQEMTKGMVQAVEARIKSLDAAMAQLRAEQNELVQKAYQSIGGGGGGGDPYAGARLSYFAGEEGIRLSKVLTPDEVLKGLFNTWREELGDKLEQPRLLS